MQDSLPCHALWKKTNNKNSSFEKRCQKKACWKRCAGIIVVMGANPVQAWIFSGPIFTTAQVVFITTKIAFIFTSLSARYDFYIFTFVYNCHNNQFVYHPYDNYYFFHLYHFVECPKITFKNSWYIISVSGWSWSLNRFICQGQGGDLISIETEEEWNFIDNEIQRRNNTNYDNRWSIGLEKRAGNWTWVSGRPLTICKWGKGEPSGEYGVTFMYKLNSYGERGVFGNLKGTS